MARGASSSVSLAWSRAAYERLVLHAAKYLASTVVGVLLGTESTVEAVVPLVHHWHQLSPMSEAGLALLAAHLAAASPLRMVGVYEVPERLDATDVSGATAQLAHALGERTGHAPVVVLAHGDRLLSAKPSALRAHQGSADVSVSLEGYATWIGELRAAVHAGQWADVVDFDEHLEHTDRDWLPRLPRA